MPLFVISFEYLAKPLMNFWHTRHFCWNLPLVNISLFVTHLICGFTRPLMDSCPIPHVFKFAIFEKIANCHYASFVVSFKFFCQTFNESFAKFAKYAIFVKPTIIDMPLLSSCLNFCQICHFYKIVICQDAPFCHPFVFGQTLELSIFVEIAVFA